MPGLPGTSGFVGEFMVIMASFSANFWFAFVAATTLILGAAYTLWMVKRVMYGEVAEQERGRLSRILPAASSLVLGILAVAVLLVGLWPAPLVDMMSVSVENLVRAGNQADPKPARSESVVCMAMTFRSTLKPALPEIVLLSADLRGSGGRSLC